MIVLFTDFGPTGPYVGQVKAVLQECAPGVPVVDLMSDVPAFRPIGAAYLLASLAPPLPLGSVFLCVIDPGVGGDRRAPAVFEVDGRWFVGPDNGLFAMVAQRGARARRWKISWRPPRLSNTFHGRDLFAPVAGKLAKDVASAMDMLARDDAPHEPWPENLEEIIYADHFGNLFTGIRADSLDSGKELSAGGARFARSMTFESVSPGESLWYENSIGLAELAVNQGSAAELFDLKVGDPVAVMPPAKS